MAQKVPLSIIYIGMFQLLSQQDCSSSSQLCRGEVEWDERMEHMRKVDWRIRPQIIVWKVQYLQVERDARLSDSHQRLQAATRKGTLW